MQSSWISSTELSSHWGKELFELLECIRVGLTPYRFGKPATNVPQPRMSKEQIHTWATERIDLHDLGKSFDDGPTIFIRGRGIIPLAEAWINYAPSGQDNIFDTGPKNAFILFFSYGPQAPEEIEKRAQAVYAMQGEPEATESVISELRKCQFKRTEADKFAREHKLPRVIDNSRQKDIPNKTMEGCKWAMNEIGVLYNTVRQAGPLTKSTEAQKMQAVLDRFEKEKRWKYVTRQDIDDRDLYLLNSGHERRDFEKALLRKISERKGWNVPLKDIYEISKK
ncbi:MAG: hypothetical protein K9M96_07305 [Deltaproteobacteria bacterium]|nr:hypothetical protein [Deltaproteobacteria bacterium]